MKRVQGGWTKGSGGGDWGYWDGRASQLCCPSMVSWNCARRVYEHEPPVRWISHWLRHASYPIESWWGETITHWCNAWRHPPLPSLSRAQDRRSVASCLSCWASGVAAVTTRARWRRRCRDEPWAVPCRAPATPTTRGQERRRRSDDRGRGRRDVAFRTSLRQRDAKRGLCRS